jgi:hypothetical protein
VSNVAQSIGVLVLPGTPSGVILARNAFTAASVTLSFSKNAFKRITVMLCWDAGGISNIGLTGMSAGTFLYNFTYSAGAGTQNASGITVAANNWAISTASGATSPGSGIFDFILPPAPARKSFVFNEQDGFTGANPITRAGGGQSSDVTNDPTAIVFTLDASRTGYVHAVGYP